MAERLITLHIEDVPASALTDALIAIERADEQGVYDGEQHRRLTRLVHGLREAREPDMAEFPCAECGAPVRFVP